MKNFYYVLTLNVSNPIVKSMLDRQGFLSNDTVDFKIRSKLFLSFTEATIAAHGDFDKKLNHLYTDKEVHHVRNLTVLNPAYGLVSVDLEEIANQFGHHAAHGWDDNCCSVIFFADSPTNDIDEPLQSPNSWLIKYEVMCADDPFEAPTNGDFIFTPTNMSSSYH